MKSKLGFIAVSSVIVLAIIIIFAVSIEKREQPVESKDMQVKADSGLVEDENMNMGEVPEQVIPIEPEPAETLQVSFAYVKDLTFWNDRIAAGTEGGVFTYKPEDSSYQFFYYANGLKEYDVNALLQVEDKLIVGTQGGLAQIDQAGNIENIDFGFEPPVTALAESQGSLLIGTAKDGLIAYQDGTGQLRGMASTVSTVWNGRSAFWLTIPQPLTMWPILESSSSACLRALPTGCTFSTAEDGAFTMKRTAL